MWLDPGHWTPAGRYRSVGGIPSSRPSGLKDAPRARRRSRHARRLLAAGLVALAVTAGVSEPALATTDAIPSAATLRQWRALLHFQPNGESTARSTSFFLSPNGRKDSVSELRASIAAFSPHPVGRDGQGDPRCRFPARYHFLKQRGLVPNAHGPSCDRFERFARRIAVRRVAVVFATSFLGSPQSAFGHVFVRLDRVTLAGRPLPKLVSTAVSFSAAVDQTSLLAYLAGLVRRLVGRYRLLPYHQKVREYNRMERRSLWSYELALTRASVNQLVRHLWEIRDVEFDYWFVTGNCSKATLALLDAVAPDLALARQLSWAATPVQALRLLRGRPSLVRSIQYRPSLDRQLAAQIRHASTDDVKQTTRLALTLAPPATGTSVSTLDLAMLWSRAEAASMHRGRRHEIRRQRALLRAARSRLRPSKGTPKPAHPPPPDLGHGAAAVSITGGIGHGGSPAYELGFRPLMHHVTDPSLGYEVDGTFEIGTTVLRLSGPKTAPQLQSFSLVHVSSFAPSTTLQPRRSWRLWAGSRRFAGEGCAECLAAVADVGFGLTLGYGVGSARLRLYGLLDVETQVPFGALGYSSLAAGPSLGLLVDYDGRWSALLQASARVTLFGAAAELRRWLFEVRYRLIRTVAIRTVGEWQYTGARPLLARASAQLGLIVYL